MLCFLITAKIPHRTQCSKLAAWVTRGMMDCEAGAAALSSPTMLARTHLSYYFAFASSSLSGVASTWRFAANDACRNARRRRRTARCSFSLSRRVFLRCCCCHVFSSYSTIPSLLPPSPDISSFVDRRKATPEYICSRATGKKLASVVYSGYPPLFTVSPPALQCLLTCLRESRKDNPLRDLR